MEVIPFNPIIGFTHIELESSEAFFTLMVLQPVLAFITDNNIVRNGSTWNEGALERINNIIHDNFDSVSDGSCDDFVGHIAETYGSVLLDCVGVLNLRDKSNQGLVLILKKGPIIENF